MEKMLYLQLVQLASNHHLLCVTGSDWFPWCCWQDGSPWSCCEYGSLDHFSGGQVELRAHCPLKHHRASLDPLAPLESLARMVPVEPVETLAPLAHLESRVWSDPLVSLETRELLESLVLV